MATIDIHMLFSSSFLRNCSSTSSIDPISEGQIKRDYAAYQQMREQQAAAVFHKQLQLQSQQAAALQQQMQQLRQPNNNSNNTTNINNLSNNSNGNNNSGNGLNSSGTSFLTPTWSTTPQFNNNSSGNNNNSFNNQFNQVCSQDRDVSLLSYQRSLYNYLRYFHLRWKLFLIDLFISYCLIYLSI